METRLAKVNKKKKKRVSSTKSNASSFEEVEIPKGIEMETRSAKAKNKRNKRSSSLKIKASFVDNNMNSEIDNNISSISYDNQSLPRDSNHHPNVLDHDTCQPLPCSNSWDYLSDTSDECQDRTINENNNNLSRLRKMSHQHTNNNTNMIHTQSEPSKGKFHFPDNAIILPVQGNDYKPLEGPNSNYVATQNNKKLYCELVNYQESLKFHEETDKKAFVINFIEHKMAGYVFYQYCELEHKYHEVDAEVLYTAIHKRFNNLKSTRSSLLKKGKLFKENDSFPYHIDKKNKVSNDLLSSLRWICKKQKKLFDYLDWNYFSMFHSTYQSFSFVVYNSSHILNDNESVHRCTRVKLNFPQNANCVLVIHGRLVHSGSESKTETEISFNTSHDTRLFAYLSNLKSRKLRIEKYKNHLEPDTVDRATFTLCDNRCKKCQAYNRAMKKKKLVNDEIDVSHYIDLNNSMIGTRRNSLVQQQSRKLLGDLDALGWEVWTGIDTSLEKYVYLNSHLRTFILGNGKSLWNGIGSTPRKALKIDKLLGEKNNAIKSSLAFMVTVFDDIREHVLVKIPRLGSNIKLDGRALLANFDELDEQIPHRDFSSIKR
jgi:hypothetical protein